MQKEMIKSIKDIYERNQNVIEYLKQSENRTENTTEDIMISYDFQAGTYIDTWYNEPQKFKPMNREIAQILDGYMDKFKDADKPIKVMEGGVGEGNTMLDIMNFSKSQVSKQLYGFDISWSRVKYAKRFLEEKMPASPVSLFLGNFLNIPILDNAVDIVYTVHAIEPNGGKEREILEELYRITGKYLILIEPIYELASPEAQARMNRHGYIKGLYDTAKQLGYKVLEYRLMDNIESALNPNGVIVIEKNPSGESSETIWADPISGKPMDLLSLDSFWCSDSLLMYPVVGGIPCLLEEYSILAAKYSEFHKKEN